MKNTTKESVAIANAKRAKKSRTLYADNATTIDRRRKELDLDFVDYVDQMVLNDSISNITDEAKELLEQVKALGNFDLKTLVSSAIVTKCKMKIANAKRLKTALANKKEGEILTVKGAAAIRIGNFIDDHIKNNVQKPLTQTYIHRELRCSLPSLRKYIAANRETLDNYNKQFKK